MKAKLKGFGKSLDGQLVNIPDYIQRDSEPKLYTQAELDKAVDKAVLAALKPITFFDNQICMKVKLSDGNYMYVPLIECIASLSQPTNQVSEGK